MPYPTTLADLIEKDEAAAKKMIDLVRAAIVAYEVRGQKPFSAAMDIEDGIVVMFAHDASHRYAVRLIDDLKDIIFTTLKENNI